MNSKLIKFSRFIGKRDFIRRSLRYRVFTKLKMDFEFEVNFYGYKYRGNLNNYIDRSVFFFGAHEKEQMNFSKKYIKDCIVIDCGSNTGNHSLFYSAFSKQVISIEANETLVKDLKNRIHLNKISNIDTYNCGAGSQNAKSLPFYISESDNYGVSSFIDNFAPNNSIIKQVEIKTLDSIVMNYKNSKIGFIKIDCEGFDYEVLKGARGLISRDMPLIQIEYNPRDLNKLNDFLVQHPMYTPMSLIVNQPFFIFNFYKGDLSTFNSKLRSEVFLIPEFK